MDQEAVLPMKQITEFCATGDTGIELGCGSAASFNDNGTSSAHWGSNFKCFCPRRSVNMATQSHSYMVFQKQIIQFFSRILINFTAPATICRGMVKTQYPNFVSV